MVDLDEARRGLERIDWDFPRSGTSSLSVHNSHWSLGNFIPQIPAAFIQLLSATGQTVLDPFAGSGTTGIEAARLGRRAVMSDALLSSLLVMQGKIALANGALAGDENDRLLRNLVWEHEMRSDEIGANGEGSDPFLESWFSRSTLAQLRFIWGIIERESGQVRDALRLIFSDVLFACASSKGARTSTGGLRRHHWGWIADNVQPKLLVDHDAGSAFRERLASAKTLQRIAGEQPVISREDARQLSLPDSSVDLVVTSPPYVGVIDYTHANRLLYAWMGWPLRIERSNEIGARYKRARLKIIDEYLADMDLCWGQICRVLRPGGYCAIVIGESRTFPDTVAETTRRLGERLELAWGPITRIPTRRRVSEREARPAVEQILVYRKSC